jgi:hypothetical protein
MTNNQLTDLRTLILSEVGDFFAGFGSPGEPETPEKMQRELTMRLGRILNNHIVNYPRCEALVEILRECRIARDEAQAGLQECRKFDQAKLINKFYERYPLDTFKGIPNARRRWAITWLALNYSAAESLLFMRMPIAMNKQLTAKLST